MRVGPDFFEEPHGVERVDRVLGATENRCIDSGCKGNSKRIVRGHGHSASGGADETVHVVRMSHDARTCPEFSHQYFFQYAKSGRCRCARTIVIERNMLPVWILPIENAFQPARHRGHSHLYEEAGIIYDFSQWSSQDKLIAIRFHDSYPALGARDSNLSRSDSEPIVVEFRPWRIIPRQLKFHGQTSHRIAAP